MKIIAQDISHLRKLIKHEIDSHGYQCDLNGIDVSRVTDMKYLFCMSKFNGDIREWNVSQVRDMNGVFYKSKFNGDISKWDVSNVTNIYEIFYGSEFSGDLNPWKPYTLKSEKV